MAPAPIVVCARTDRNGLLRSLEARGGLGGRPRTVGSGGFRSCKPSMTSLSFGRNPRRWPVSVRLVCARHLTRTADTAIPNAGQFGTGFLPRMRRLGGYPPDEVEVNTRRVRQTTCNFYTNNLQSDTQTSRRLPNRLVNDKALHVNSARRPSDPPCNRPVVPRQALGVWSLELHVVVRASNHCLSGRKNGVLGQSSRDPNSTSRPKCRENPKFANLASRP